MIANESTKNYLSLKLPIRKLVVWLKAQYVQERVLWIKIMPCICTILQQNYYLN